MSDIVKIIKANHDKVMMAIRKIGKNNECCTSNAETQFNHLKALDLHEEFPYGCDSIRFVAKKLLEQRKEKTELLILLEKILELKRIEDVHSEIKKALDYFDKKNY